MTLLLVIVGGVLLLGALLGFFGAVSLGMMREDRHAGRRSLREGTNGPLPRLGRRLVGFTADPPPASPEVTGPRSPHQLGKGSRGPVG